MGMDTSQYFPDPLRLEALPEMENHRRQWILLSPFRYNSPQFGQILCPQGMRTDLASTPRSVWTVVSPTDEYMYAAIPHDFLYRADCPLDFTKEQADLVLLEGYSLMEQARIEKMGLKGVKKWLAERKSAIRRGLVYNAVKYFAKYRAPK